jgi:hypothetical protein
MASKTITELVDDIDGGQAAETVSFGLDGVGYEIDLSDKNAAKLRKVLDQYVTAARRVGGRRKRPASSDYTADVRAWAQKNGYEIAERGRISKEIRDAYAAR